MRDLICSIVTVMRLNLRYW